jgi:7,8-dihydropterin-6-yl-methyl-4-(beta-D-ribofuranosyl)aminobenzene 5'-phosphate synthase
MIVISHNHSDHTGGLDAVFEKRKDLPIYLPASVDINFKEQFSDFADQTIPVSQPIEICEGIFLTGEMGDMIKEQSLIVETKKGLVIVTGCSHQGVDNIVKKATKMSDKKIYLTFGGFHLLRHSEDQILNIIDVFLCEGVQKCGPTHCTGKEATMLFKETYGENFVEIGAGNRIRI